MPAPYYVVLDANVWIAEHLMQSAIGGAFLYAVTGARSSIVLPEIVELEVANMLPNLGERSVDIIRRELSLLRHLSGHNLTVTAPSTLAIEDGIKERWKQLDGLLIRVPFTFEQAKSALQRILRKAPPSGENNEQFRDCCIWEAALSMATERTVHLVTADNAFYENRNREKGFAASLRAELIAAKREIHIHSSLKDFLATAGSGAAVDEVEIGDEIIKAILDQSREIAAKKEFAARPGPEFQLGKVYQPKISGFATPKSSLIAISFEVSFDLERTITADEMELRDEATMTLKGVCSYDPIKRELSEIEIRDWHKSGKSPSGTWGSSWGAAQPDKRALELQYGPGRMRFLP